MMGLNCVKSSKQMRLTLLVFVVSVLLVLAVPVTITKADIDWEKSYGDIGNEMGSWVEKTGDRGYIIVGYTDAIGAGEEDVWLIKTYENGDKDWDRTFGGTDIDEGYCVIQTTDLYYIVAGYTESFGAGDKDVWLIKTDLNGNLVWNKTFGGMDDDVGRRVLEASDGGYIIAGYTDSYGAGWKDVWLIKTDENGNHQWNKTYGGTDGDEGYCVAQTTDGGYIIVGTTDSYGAGSIDVWLIKTDENGDHQWNKTYGGIQSEEGKYVEQTTDGGCIITGNTLSYGSDPAVSTDIWLIKTDENGNKEWDQTFGEEGVLDGSSCVVQTSDEGYIIAGFGFTFLTFEGLLIKTDENGNEEWEETYKNKAASHVLEISDEEYIIVGMTADDDGDVWLAKVSPSEFPWTMVLLVVVAIGMAVVLAIFFKKRKQEA